ncbi:8320_t:CDS:2 [Cetraspora pellucida]|uniref:8320_t:CDS:1 n=1 Tax=Cetraspora pellucida TaxID=1433469 RepID=A0ACA9LQP8_9GLOM|nr:8320_t:CDS:2 [Cetraspora pellucida]
MREIETKKEELIQAQEEFTEEAIKNETEYIERLQEAEQNLEKIKEKSKNYRTVNFSILSQGLGTPKNIFFANQQEVDQARKLYEKITQNLEKKESEDYLTSPASQEFLQLIKTSGAELDDEERELAAKIENKQKQQDYQAISQRVEKMPAVPNELTKILTKLLSNLQEEQIIAIFSQSYQVKDNQTELNATYSHLTKEQKLKLLNSGLDNLQINTTEQKQELLNIILTKKQEEIHFDLTITEKENILRLITSQVSQNQLETYEEYGVPLYNAARLADDLITVDEKEAKKNLANADSSNLNNFSLSPQQENILKTLSPLRREYSYSDNLLKRLRKLNSRNFLVQKEIIPVEYKKIADPYQELKKEILKKKYRQIREEIKQREKEQVAQESQELRNSLLPALLYFAQMNVSLSSSGNSRTIAAIPNITSLEEKYERLATAYEKMRDYIEDKEVFVEAPENITPEQPTETTSTTDNLYDDLFSNLDQEEAEKLRKKKAREEAKKKLAGLELLKKTQKLITQPSERE